MTNEEILKKAIEKVRKNGFERMLIDIDLSTEYPLIIFSHDFAKAFWGSKKFFHNPLREQKDYRVLEEVKTRENAEEFTGYFEEWQYQLQQMVLEEQPLKYLEKFL